MYRYLNQAGDISDGHLPRLASLGVLLGLLGKRCHYYLQANLPYAVNAAQKT